MSIITTVEDNIEVLMTARRNDTLENVMRTGTIDGAGLLS